MKQILRCSAALILLILYVAFDARAGEEGFKYRSPKEINNILRTLAKENRKAARLHQLGRTPGGRDLLLLEIGREGKTLPGVLVVANMEGNSPPASEAALELSRLLLGEWKDDLKVSRWYIVPSGNPDGYANYFRRPLREDFLNEKPFNADNDDAVDEDSPEDLNGDGHITTLRQKHPEGKWLPVEGNPALMKKAETAKGEQGIYRLYSEGLDDDGDGKYNEDGPGGTNPGHNFPHNFEHYTPTDGLWAASEIESRTIMRFAFDHPDIALVLTFGRSNSLMTVPESKKKAEVTGAKYKVPERYAERLGIDPDEELPLKEITDMFRDLWGRPQLTEERVLIFLGAGAAVNPDRNDLPYWKEISRQYNDFLKEAGLDDRRLDPPKFSPGCIEEWAYYQYGVPSFSMDFWTVPIVKKEENSGDTTLTPKAIEKMTNEEFIQLGEERIGELLEVSGAPAHFNGAKIIEELQSGTMTTRRIAEMLRRSVKGEEEGEDEEESALYDYNQDAYLPWQPFDHPTLGKVEIGGKIPYSNLAPPENEIGDLISKQLPFLREIIKLLPRIAIEKVELERRGSDVWKLDIWITNAGFLPYPSHQGKRCRRPTPAVVNISGTTIDLLEGRARVVLGLLNGSGGSQKASWLIRAFEGAGVVVEVHSPSADGDTLNVTLKEGGER